MSLRDRKTEAGLHLVMKQRLNHFVSFPDDIFTIKQNPGCFLTLL